MDLCTFFGNCWILDGDWTQVMPVKNVPFVKQATKLLMKRIRPNCVSLVDALDFPDLVLNSSIGRSDGNV